MPRILIVEDDVHLGEGLVYNFERAGYEVEWVVDGGTALSRCAQASPDLVILDLMLPDMDGFEVLARLREQGRDPPVIILSARSSETDKIRGLDTGADDYVTKPFGVGELLARVRTRLAGSEPARAFALGGARVDLDRHTVEGEGEVHALTPTEVQILEHLAAHRDLPVDRTDLMRAIWGTGLTTSRTLDAHVTRLRRKIEADPAHPRHLVTVHGVGYRLTW